VCDTDTTEAQAIRRLSRDLAVAAKTMHPDEARFLVDAYYIIQEDRKRSGNQVKAMEKSHEPHDVLLWFFDQNRVLEGQIKRALDQYAKNHPLGDWLYSIVGIGPVLSAGMLCYFDFETRQRAAGELWKLAGLDPSSTWEKRQKRPWNAGLKTLCYKIGESFVKSQNLDGSFYGPLFAERKGYEIQRNRNGDLVDQAECGAQRVKKKTEAWPWYAGCYPASIWDGYLALPLEERAKRHTALRGEPGTGTPMLPPAHIHSRARRWTVKLFLSHLAEMGSCYYHHRPLAMPFAIARLGHKDYIPPPNPPSYWIDPR
jgi:hypothetical protein